MQTYTIRTPEVHLISEGSVLIPYSFRQIFFIIVNQNNTNEWDTYSSIISHGILMSK